MTSSVSTSKSRPFFKNKYIEYRKMYDEARNFSKSLDTASTTDSKAPKASKDPLPPETSSKDSKPAETKGLAKKSGETPYGVRPSDAPSAPEATSSAPLSTAAVNVPNTGAASDRMLDRVKEYEPHIRAAAERYGLPPELIAGVIWQESRGNSRAVSHCGAMGLMQLMPATAAGMGINNAFDAGQNIDGGSKYLRQMLDKFNGRVDFAVAAYNAGPGNVSKFGGVPPFRETQDYVPKVLGFANSFRVAQAFTQSVPSNAVRV
ncbi:MAG: lytic transglycosylase domain-containing protein [Deltaproteobacteria bacterium]|nr:lytic transglycosylase domain-containing protein [Deltaproteobacteria bacterium]